MNFGQMQAMMLRNYLIDGKALAILRYIPAPGKNRVGRLCIQLIPKSQLCTFRPTSITNKNDFYAGMEINKKGEVVVYWFNLQSPYSEISPEKPVRIARWGRITNREIILDITSQPRVGHVFGVSRLAVILEDLYKIERYRLAELKAAMVNASIALTVENNFETPVNPLAGGVGKKVGENESAQEADEIMTTERSGMIIVQGNRGTKLQGFDTKRPTTNFQNFTEAIMKQISSVCGIPPEILLKSFSSNYSASRAAINEMWEEIIRDRALITNNFCNPVYSSWLHDEILNGRIEAPGYFSDDSTDRQILRNAYQQAKWAGLPRQNLDPVKEARAHEIAETHAWTTAEEISEQHYNSDFYLNAKKRKQEKEAMPSENQ